MTPRIDPCEARTRHRWKVRRHYYSTPEQVVYDRQCIWCGKWYTDVVIR